jgi:hypothetical protein
VSRLVCASECNWRVLKLFFRWCCHNRRQCNRLQACSKTASSMQSVAAREAQRFDSASVCLQRGIFSRFNGQIRKSHPISAKSASNSHSGFYSHLVPCPGSRGRSWRGTGWGGGRCRRASRYEHSLCCRYRTEDGSSARCHVDQPRTRIKRKGNSGVACTTRMPKCS